jgi:hypothetical protein
MSVSWHFEDHHTFTFKISSFTIQYQKMPLFRETSTPRTPPILSPLAHKPHRTRTYHTHMYNEWDLQSFCTPSSTACPMMKACWYFQVSETCSPKKSVTSHNNSIFKMYCVYNCELQNYCHSIRIWLHDNVHTSYTQWQMSLTTDCCWILNFYFQTTALIRCGDQTSVQSEGKISNFYPERPSILHMAS